MEQRHVEILVMYDFSLLLYNMDSLHYHLILLSFPFCFKVGLRVCLFILRKVSESLEIV